MGVHRCVRCGMVYPPGAKQLLDGCSCGSRVFAFVRGDDGTMIEGIAVGELSRLEGQAAGAGGRGAGKDGVVSVELDPDNVRVMGPGSYALNIDALARGDPVVIRASEGIYYIKLPAVKPKPAAASATGGPGRGGDGKDSLVSADGVGKAAEK